jgi:hypothetical protein
MKVRLYQRHLGVGRQLEAKWMILALLVKVNLLS